MQILLVMTLRPNREFLGKLVQRLPFEEAFDAFDDDFGDGMLDGLL
jgi:hypothetical protein